MKGVSDGTWSLCNESSLPSNVYKSEANVLEITFNGLPGDRGCQFSSHYDATNNEDNIFFLPSRSLLPRPREGGESVCACVRVFHIHR